MPELPDLQVFSRNLTKELSTRTLEKIVIRPALKKEGTASGFKELEGQKLKEVYREGKELRFAFTKDVLGLHLMLHGKLYWAQHGVQPNTLFTMAFSKGKILGLTDFQKLAKISLNPAPVEVPDALSKEMNTGRWAEILRSRAAVKNILLDQQQVRGIGNAYADEILWQAGISPFAIANKIPPAAIKKLAAAVRKVLISAEKNILRKEPGIIGGEVRDFLVIHNPKLETSPTGERILQKTVGGRKTYYTNEQETF